VIYYLWIIDDMLAVTASSDRIPEIDIISISQKMKLLGTKYWWVSRPRIKYSPEIIQRAVAWMVFCKN